MVKSTRRIFVCPPKFGDIKAMLDAINDLSARDRTATRWLLAIATFESVGRLIIWLAWIWCAYKTSFRIWGG